MTQVSDSFLLVVPYLVLPLQLLLLLKGIEKNKLLPFALYLGLLNGLCFGINLIFDVIAVGLLGLYGLWLVFIERRASFRFFVSFLVMTLFFSLIFTAFWLVPLLYSALLDRGNTQYLLQSETFYNIDTSPLEVLRGLGNWSFFSSYNGTPYNAFAEVYKGTILLFTGLLTFAIAFLAGFSLTKPERKSDKLPLLFFLIIFLLSLPFIGGTHVGWVTTNFFDWAFKSIPFFMAFRNTYKLASLEFLSLALVICGAALWLNDWFRKNRQVVFAKWALLIITIASIGLSAFPFFTNQLFSQKNNIKDIPGYWLTATAYVNSHLGPDSGRLLLLPNQYFETLSWSGTIKTTLPRDLEDTLFSAPTVHNSCVGCDAANSATLITYIYQNLSNPSTYNLLGMLNVSHILQRNDFAYQYYKVESPGQIKSILAQQSAVLPVQTFGKLDLYKINPSDVYPLVYSPQRLTGVSKYSELSEIARENPTNSRLAGIFTSQVSKSQTLTGAMSGLFKSVFDLDETTVSRGQATDSVKILSSNGYDFKQKQDATRSYSVSYQYVGGHYLLELTPIRNQLSIDGKKYTQQAEQPIEKDLGEFSPTTLVVSLDRSAYILQPIQHGELSSLTTSSSIININTYPTSEASSNLVSDGGFESGPWQSRVSDCQKSHSNANISMSIVKGVGTEGDNALQLTALQDSACSYSRPISNFRTGVYLVQFDYRNVSGAAPAYCIWNGEGCASYDLVGTRDHEWHTYSTAANLGGGSTNVSLYLYSRKSNFSKTKNLYDNVRIYLLQNPTNTTQIFLPAAGNGAGKVQLTKGEHVFAANLLLSNRNLVENGSFESGLWQSSVSDCSSSNYNEIGMRISEDAFSGKRSLELDSTGDLACTASDAIAPFNSSQTYLISLNYKVAKGTTARVCVWDQKQCLTTNTMDPGDRKWHQYQAIVQPAPTSRPLSVYLYSDGSKTPAEVLYDNIQVRQIQNSFLSDYSLQLPSPQLQVASKIRTVHQNDSRYVVSFDAKATSLLVFQQSYHPGWRAYVTSSSGKMFQIPKSDHIQVNGFENGWWFEPKTLPSNFQSSDGTYHVIFYFYPQRIVNLGVLATFTALIISIIYISWVWFVRRGM